MMKCSEMAVATSNLLAELIPKYLDQVYNCNVNYTRLAERDGGRNREIGGEDRSIHFMF